MPLAERQAAFASALCEPLSPVPEGCVGPLGLPDPKRFAVYRNNVVASLIEAIEAAYPAVRRILGEECFHGVARLYVLEHPPYSPLMLEYGQHFADFLGRCAPLARYPYLADVARIERAWLEAYHAAEAEPPDAAALADIATCDPADLVFSLHPSLRLVSSPFPVLSIWHANRQEEPPPVIELDAGAERVLIARPAAEVEARLLPTAAALFLESLVRGDTLAVAAAAVADTMQFDLASHLAALFESGLITGVGARGRRVSPNH